MTSSNATRFEDLRIGQSASFAKTITEVDVGLFAGITGDFNPLHVNQPTAEASRFGGRIAHGMLSASLICTVLGMHLPGPGTVHLGQSLRFLKPVRISDTITATAEIIELFAEQHRVRLRTYCVNQNGDLVLDGEASVLFQPG